MTPDEEIAKLKKSLFIVEELWAKKKFNSKEHELNWLRSMNRKRHARYMNSIANGRD